VILADTHSQTHRNSQMIRTPRVAIVCDLLEENWESMDLVGRMLEKSLRELGGNLEVVRICPSLRRRFTPVDGSTSGALFNADRFMNRFWDYPKWLRELRDEFDLFHIVDHSYSQLVHHLPAHRTIVTCHDLDTFRSVLEPAQERRSFVFRAMTRHSLGGLRKAARVTCDSIATKSELLTHGLIEPERVSVVTNGIHPSCSPIGHPDADREADRLLGPVRAYDLLHVGTTIPRKRIDVLLEVVARVRRQVPDVRLVRAGGSFTAEQRALASRLNLTDAIVVLPRLERDVLAAIYRRASLALLPSEREGFGLPLAEAMACGIPVIASDLQVLREVGGEAAEYCAVGDIDTWTHAIMRLLQERNDQDAWQRRRDLGLHRASSFTWAGYARRMAGIYSDLLSIESV
jgi:glycosyltransferase involved in cell wall biosynthesis